VIDDVKWEWNFFHSHSIDSTLSHLPVSPRPSNSFQDENDILASREGSERSEGLEHPDFFVGHSMPGEQLLIIQKLFPDLSPAARTSEHYF
jgi:hypothetical protein